MTVWALLLALLVSGAQGLENDWWVIDGTPPETVHAPVLTLLAPEDRMVVSRLHSDFCSRRRDCELAVFPGARLELFTEVDEHPQRVLQRVESFLERLVRDPGP